MKRTFTASLQRLFSYLKSIFLSGLFSLIPITATIVIVHFCYTLIARWLKPLRAIEPEVLQHIPGSEFIIITMIIFGIGLLLKLFIVEPLIHKVEKIITHIPIIRSIYSAAKTMVDFFNVPDPIHAKRKVVLIEFPRKGCYNLAFLLGPASGGFRELISKHSADTQEAYCRVFMPNSPNPTTGYFFLLPASEVIDTDITFEEAIKTIVSCGLITPPSLLKETVPHDFGSLPPL